MGLQLLQEMVRVSHANKIYVRELLLEDDASNTSWLRCLLRIICERRSDDITEIGSSTVFGHGCHLLFHLTRDDPTVAKTLVRANALQLIGEVLCRVSGGP